MRQELIQTQIFDRLAIYITSFNIGTGFVEMEIPGGFHFDFDLVHAYFKDDTTIHMERTNWGERYTFSGTFKDYNLACYVFSKRHSF